MDYLARESSPFEESFWQNIDKVVVETASRTLIGRRFLSIYGPLGAGAISVQYDKSDREEVFEDGFVKTSGRKSVELPQIYQDFTLLWRDLENNISNKLPLDLSFVDFTLTILGASIIVCLSSYYPAYKASLLMPIQALAEE